MKAIKIRATEDQSIKAIQEYMFDKGYVWTGDDVQEINYVDCGIGGGFYGYANGHMGWDFAEAFSKQPHEEEFLPMPEEFREVPQPIKSDGGSSDYYKLTITNKAGESIQCETGDVLRVMVGNDYDLSNILKAARRMYEASQGRGKEGATIEYDANKIIYFANEFAHWRKQC